ncbi:hypothetical protein RJT34_30473 [Clitoria ternatea]|uniref:Uncharacterized protein n=1 Tax=Clitoria ternatea TaxID=43366 RepID=A0AAN9ESF8_CLITE
MITLPGFHHFKQIVHGYQVARMLLPLVIPIQKVNAPSFCQRSVTCSLSLELCPSICLPLSPSVPGSGSSLIGAQPFPSSQVDNPEARYYCLGKILLLLQAQLVARRIASLFCPSCHNSVSQIMSRCSRPINWDRVVAEQITDAIYYYCGVARDGNEGGVASWRWKWRWGCSSKMEIRMGFLPGDGNEGGARVVFSGVLVVFSGVVVVFSRVLVVFSGVSIFCSDLQVYA